MELLKCCQCSIVLGGDSGCLLLKYCLYCTYIFYTLLFINDLYHNFFKKCQKLLY